jgi:hypothetical protein
MAIVGVLFSRFWKATLKHVISIDCLGLIYGALSFTVSPVSGGDILIHCYTLPGIFLVPYFSLLEQKRDSTTSFDVTLYHKQRVKVAGH